MKGEKNPKNKEKYNFSYYFNDRNITSDKNKTISLMDPNRRKISLTISDHLESSREFKRGSKYSKMNLDINPKTQKRFIEYYDGKKNINELYSIEPILIEKKTKRKFFSNKNNFETSSFLENKFNKDQNNNMSNTGWLKDFKISESGKFETNKKEDIDIGSNLYRSFCPSHKKSFYTKKFDNEENYFWKIKDYFFKLKNSVGEKDFQKNVKEIERRYFYLKVKKNLENIVKNLEKAKKDDLQNISSNMRIITMSLKSLIYHAEQLAFAEKNTSEFLFVEFDRKICNFLDLLNSNYFFYSFENESFMSISKSLSKESRKIITQNQKLNYSKFQKKENFNNNLYFSQTYTENRSKNLFLPRNRNKIKISSKDKFDILTQQKIKNNAKKEKNIDNNYKFQKKDYEELSNKSLSEDSENKPQNIREDFSSSLNTKTQNLFVNKVDNLSSKIENFQSENYELNSPQDQQLVFSQTNFYPKKKSLTKRKFPELSKDIKIKSPFLLKNISSNVNKKNSYSSSPNILKNQKDLDSENEIPIISEIQIEDVSNDKKINKSNDEKINKSNDKKITESNDKKITEQKKKLSSIIYERDKNIENLKKSDFIFTKKFENDKIENLHLERENMKNELLMEKIKNDKLENELLENKKNFENYQLKAEGEKRELSENLEIIKKELSKRIKRNEKIENSYMKKIQENDKLEYIMKNQKIEIEKKNKKINELSKNEKKIEKEVKGLKKKLKIIKNNIKTNFINQNSEFYLTTQSEKECQKSKKHFKRKSYSVDYFNEKSFCEESEISKNGKMIEIEKFIKNLVDKYTAEKNDLKEKLMISENEKNTLSQNLNDLKIKCQKMRITNLHLNKLKRENLDLKEKLLSLNKSKFYKCDDDSNSRGSFFQESEDEDFKNKNKRSQFKSNEEKSSFIKKEDDSDFEVEGDNDFEILDKECNYSENDKSEENYDNDVKEDNYYLENNKKKEACNKIKNNDLNTGEETISKKKVKIKQTGNELFYKDKKEDKIKFGKMDNFKNDEKFYKQKSFSSENEASEKSIDKNEHVKDQDKKQNIKKKIKLVRKTKKTLSDELVEKDDELMKKIEKDFQLYQIDNVSDEIKIKEDFIIDNAKEKNLRLKSIDTNPDQRIRDENKSPKKENKFDKKSKDKLDIVLNIEKKEEIDKSENEDEEEEEDDDESDDENKEEEDKIKDEKENENENSEDNSEEDEDEDFNSLEEKEEDEEKEKLNAVLEEDNKEAEDFNRNQEIEKKSPFEAIPQDNSEDVIKRISILSLQRDTENLENTMKDDLKEKESNQNNFKKLSKDFKEELGDEDCFSDHKDSKSQNIIDQEEDDIDNIQISDEIENISEFEDEDHENIMGYEDEDENYENIMEAESYSNKNDEDIQNFSNSLAKSNIEKSCDTNEITDQDTIRILQRLKKKMEYSQNFEMSDSFEKLLLKIASLIFRKNFSEYQENTKVEIFSMLKKIKIIFVSLFNNNELEIRDCNTKLEDKKKSLNKIEKIISDILKKKMEYEKEIEKIDESIEKETKCKIEIEKELENENENKRDEEEERKILQMEFLNLKKNELTKNLSDFEIKKQNLINLKNNNNEYFQKWNIYLQGIFQEINNIENLLNQYILQKDKIKSLFDVFNNEKLDQ